MTKATQADYSGNWSTGLVYFSVDNESVNFVGELARFAILTTRRNSPFDVGVARFAFAMNMDCNALCLRKIVDGIL